MTPQSDKKKSIKRTTEELYHDPLEPFGERWDENNEKAFREMIKCMEEAQV